MNDITALPKRLKDRAEQAKRLGAKNPRFTADEVLTLVEVLEKAQAGEKQWREVVDAFCADDADWHKLTNSNNELIALLSQVLCKQADRIAELEKAASEPVAWTDEVELRAVEKDGCGYLFKANPITPHADPRRVIKLYTVSPAQESCTVTVKLALPRRKTADDYVDDTFEACDLAAVYNACRLECEVKFKNALTAAGIQVIEGEQKNG